MGFDYMMRSGDKMLSHCSICDRRIAVYRTDLPVEEQRIVRHKRELKDGGKWVCPGSGRPPVYRKLEIDINTALNTTFGIETPPPLPQNMRLRVLDVPNGQFLLILDRATEMFDGDDVTLPDMGDRMTGYGGMLVFSEEVDLDQWFPHG